MGSIVMEPDDINSYAQIYYPAVNHTFICLSVRKIVSKGLFHDANPFDYSVPLLLAQLSLASIVNLLVTRLLQPIGQPSMVIHILGGLIIGPSLLGRIYGIIELVYPLRSLVMVDMLASFAYMFYFFLVGVQMDPWILEKVEKKDLKIGICTVSFALVLSMLGAFILLAGNFSLEPHIASSLPAVATATSVLGFPSIAQYLTEVNMVNSDFGRTALASSLVSNLFGFCLINILLICNMQSHEVVGILRTCFLVLCYLLLIALVVRPLILWGLRRTPEGERPKEGFILLVLVGAVLSGFCSKLMNVNIFFGPLIYGMSIPAGPPLGSALMEKLHIIISWIFMPLYLVKNGLVIDVFSVKFSSYLYVQYTVLLACLGKFVGAFLSSVYTKVPLMKAVQIGLVMNVQGIMELGLFKMLKQNKAIHDEPFIVMCVSMILVTGTVTYVLKCLYDPVKRDGARKRTVTDLRSDSELRMVACVHEQEDVPGIINLIENLHPTKSSPTSVCLIHFMELVGRVHPILISHKLARVRSGKASGSRSIVNAFKLLQQSYNDAIQLHPYTAISPYATMHDQVCEMAITRRASIIIIPFHKRFANSGSVEWSKPGIKIMNEKILEIASCTTGILVDRASVTTSRPDLGASPVHRVAVFFIGGCDDREALAVGAKMASRPNTNLTIIRILENSSDGVKKDSVEAKVDDEVVDKIRSRMRGNNRVVYAEHVVKDGTGTAAIIRAMENQYDLIIVGRHHDERSPLTFGLSNWIEDSELGTLGDMFALADSKSNSTILVIQHPRYLPGGAQQNADQSLHRSPIASNATGGNESNGLGSSATQGSSVPLRINVVQ